MDNYTLLHWFLASLCLLVLPRLPPLFEFAPKNTRDVEDLVLTHVGHIPGQGLYVCIAGPDKTTPDLSLQYTSTYIHSHSGTQTSCSGSLTYQGAELGSFCLPPCPSVRINHLPRRVSLVVTGHDRTTREATAMLFENFNISDVTPKMIHPGAGVVEVRWTGSPSGIFRVQLLKHLNANPDKSNTGEGTIINGKMDDETSMQIRQCYRESHYNDEDDDDDDDYDDDDHEEDNDDFFKWMKWRRCVALHAPRTDLPAVNPPVVVYTSAPHFCFTDTCFYYITDAPTSGVFSVAVMDFTHSTVHVSHSSPAALQEWAALTVETVMITCDLKEVNPRPRMMTVTIRNSPSLERKMNSRAVPKAGSEAVLAEDSDWPGDLQVMVINGHNHSEALRSLRGECSLYWTMGDQNLVCSVTALETLVDPQGQGPISSMMLLVSSHTVAASTLLVITDIHVRVKQVGPRAVLVLWDKDTAVSEFAVSVSPESGSANNTVTVSCDKRGSDCLVIFENLESGRYIAEVSYERQARMLFRESFVIEEELVCGSK